MLIHESDPKKQHNKRKDGIADFRQLRNFPKNISNNLLISVMRSRIREGVRKRWKIVLWKHSSIALGGRGRRHKKKACLLYISILKNITYLLRRKYGEEVS